jgi:alpha-L-rhamnosidase
MLTINEIRIENQGGSSDAAIITDRARPRFSFSMTSDRRASALRSASVEVNGWKKEVRDQLNIQYGGPALEPFQTYSVCITARDDAGEEAAAERLFRTGRLGLPWEGKWISDGDFSFESPVSPPPMVFRRRFALEKRAANLRIAVTCMGVFDLYLDGRRINADYFAPGFTDYSANLQYVVYEAGGLEAGEHEFRAIVAAGWAVGRSTHVDDVMQSKSKLEADRQALLAELRLEYEDGSTEVIGTDERFEVMEDSPWQFADFYDGEIYNAAFDWSDAVWRPATLEALRSAPQISARYGCAVLPHETFQPVAWHTAPSGELICDFGQNIAGVISIRIKGHAGQEIVFRHAEALEHGELYVQNLRSAKQEIRCSNEDLNRLQSNLVWSGKDNFVDIPTDCPQRDERQGWTGDIALFASTACSNFDMSRFLGKWLLDLTTEQTEDGALPFVIPSRKGITPLMTTSCWGDSCILVPYLANGDKELLERQYPSMKKYLKDVRRWAAMSEGEFGTPNILKHPFQFGDWCAPYGAVPDWLARGPWTGTPYYYNSCRLVSKIASILGYEEDSRSYEALAEKINEDYLLAFTDETGRMKEEFQTAYVLPLHFGMGTETQRRTMAQRLWALIEENGSHLNTGFTATPYILFALADNGFAGEAYELLLQDGDPSWLYPIHQGRDHHLGAVGFHSAGQQHPGIFLEPLRLWRCGGLLLPPCMRSGAGGGRVSEVPGQTRSRGRLAVRGVRA